MFRWRMGGFGRGENCGDAENGKEKDSQAAGEKGGVDQLMGVFLDSDYQHDACQTEEEHQTDEAYFECGQVLGFLMDYVVHGDGSGDGAEGKLK